VRRTQPRYVFELFFFIAENIVVRTGQRKYQPGRQEKSLLPFQHCGPAPSQYPFRSSERRFPISNQSLDLKKTTVVSEKGLQVNIQTGDPIN